MRKVIIKSEKLKTPTTPFSWGIKAGNFIFLSGMVGINADGNLVGKGDAKIQAKQCLENIKAAIEAAGGKVNQVIKINTFLKDLADYGKFNEARAEFFAENSIVGDFPASTAVQAKLVRDDFLIEIEAIAYLE
ncbi:MAG: RidA family protein [Candidatus Helarchaeota archaeon]|nr:RidA family protein [Candidatus Helarchaeota archaeon]